MTRYAAFLRGINVGSANRIAMPALRATAERLGYTEVRTHINSGNVMFTATGSEVLLTTALSQAIFEDFGRKIDVAVRTAEQLRHILAGNPYPAGDPSRVIVAFLTAEPPSSAPERMAAVADVPFTLAGTEVWVNYVNGLADSKLAAQFSRIVGVSSTVRNVRTVAKVLELMS